MANSIAKKRFLYKCLKFSEANSMFWPCTVGRINAVIKQLKKTNTHHPNDGAEENLFKMTRAQIACARQLYCVVRINDDEYLFLKQDPPIRVITALEMYEVISEAHRKVKHGNAEKTLKALRGDVFVPAEAINFYCSLCENCLANNTVNKSEVQKSPQLRKTNKIKQSKLNIYKKKRISKCFKENASTTTVEPSVSQEFNGINENSRAIQNCENTDLGQTLDENDFDIMPDKNNLTYVDLTKEIEDMSDTECLNQSSDMTQSTSQPSTVLIPKIICTANEHDNTHPSEDLEEQDCYNVGTENTNGPDFVNENSMGDHRVVMPERSNITYVDLTAKIVDISDDDSPIESPVNNTRSRSQPSTITMPEKCSTTNEHENTNNLDVVNENSIGDHRVVMPERKNTTYVDLTEEIVDIRLRSNTTYVDLSEEIEDVVDNDCQDHLASNKRQSRSQLSNNTGPMSKNNKKILLHSTSDLRKTNNFILYQHVFLLIEDLGSEDNASILIYKDKYTNYILLRSIPMIENGLTLELIKIFCDFGVPRQIKTNQLLTVQEALYKLRNINIDCKDIKMSEIGRHDAQTHTTLIIEKLKLWANCYECGNWALGCCVLQRELNKYIGTRTPENPISPTKVVESPENSCMTFFVEDNQSKLGNKQPSVASENFIDINLDMLHQEIERRKGVEL